jgi:invasion protein IalB
MNRWILTFVVLCAFVLAGLGVLFLPGLLTGTDNESGEQLAQRAATSPSTGDEEPTVTQGAQAPTQADKQPGASAPGPGWAVTCKSQAKEEELECGVSQTVVMKKSGKVVTNVTFRVPADTKKPEILIQLPLRLYLPAGATYQVDENTPQTVNFRACNRSGCYAQTPVTPEVLATLKTGKQLTIGFQNLARKPIRVSLSLNGFGDAYDKMQKPS